MVEMNAQYLTDTPDGVGKLQEALRAAEAVVIGAGAGLSTSAGFVYTGERLQKYFGDFVKKYRIPDMYSGGFMAMQLAPEMMWAYWSRYIYVNRYMKPPKPVYENLLGLVKDKDYFALTTNVDHCFQRAGFDKHRLFYTQGDYGLWQCSKPCHERTYDNKEKIVKMVVSQGFAIGEDGALLPPENGDGMTDFARLASAVPTDLLPHCPVCGEPMTMNLRADATFVEDDGWHEAAKRYADFLRKHEDAHILYLELGVGANTPGIVKYPFWERTMENQNAFYACVNYGEAFAPKELKDRAICINGDIGDILEKLK